MSAAKKKVAEATSYFKFSLISAPGTNPSFTSMLTLRATEGVIQHISVGIMNSVTDFRFTFLLLPF